MPKPVGIFTPSGLGIQVQVGPVIATSGLTRAQYLHQNPATSTTQYAFSSPNTAGNLLVAAVSAASGTNVSTMSDSAGNTWTALGFDVNNNEIKLFYVLSCIGGANSVAVTCAGTGIHFVAVEYFGGIWTIDSSLTSGSFKHGAGVGGTTTPTSSAFSTAGLNDLIFMALCDQSQAQSSVTKDANFTDVIQAQNTTPFDAQQEWLSVPPQTNQTASLTMGTATGSNAVLGVAAFTCS